MVCLLNNRRKYTQEHVAPAGGGVWADFNLSKTGAHVADKQLIDPASAYLSNQPLRCYGITPVVDGSLLIAAEGQGHGYVWGFASGHSFELDYANSFYSSRTGSFSSFYGIMFNADGTAIYRQSGGSTAVYMQSLGSVYNLATAGAATTVFNSYGQGIITVPYYFMFSSDGKRLFYKHATGNMLHCMELGEAWPTTPPTKWDLKAVNLSSFDTAISGSTNTWNAFTLSPDGKCIVLTTNLMVVKFVLSTPWDLSTIALHSYKSLLDDVRSVSGDSSVSVTLSGVAINDAGTKMIVHNRAGGTTAKCRFFEYNLVV